MQQQLLVDGQLVLTVARTPFHIRPALLLSACRAAWASNYAWVMPQGGPPQPTLEWLQVEYLLVHLRHLHARRAAAVAEHTPLDLLAAACLIPWPDTPPPAGKGWNPWVMPLRRVRDLAQHWNIRLLGREWHQGTRDLDELLARASPHLAEAVTQQMAASRVFSPMVRVGDPTERAHQLQAVSKIRHNLPSLAAIEPHLPPCMARTLKNGRERRHLKVGDRFYTAVYFHTIGQGRQPNDATGEVIRFMGDDNSRDYRATLEGVFHKPGKYPWTCNGLRKRVPFAEGNVMACPFRTSKQCLEEANLPADAPLVFPAHWTRLSMCRGDASLDW